ncbi:MAG: hypothetical protein ACYTE8_02605 [Planctomycetota bacterium]
MRSTYFSLLLVFIGVEACLADAVIVVKAMTADTITEIYVEQDRVRVELEVGMNDIQAFKNLLPDELYEKMGNKPLALKERLKKFVEEDFIIMAVEEQLSGYISEIGPRSRIIRDEITGEPLPMPPGEGETTLFVICEFPFEGEPNSITIVPPFNEAGYSMANIGFVTYHMGLAVNDFRYLSSAETLYLDWEDPWYSQFSKRSLWRRYKEPISAFIYVEPFEVRKEIIVRPKDLQHWIDLGLEGKDIIKAEEQGQIKKKVSEFLSDKHVVFIDETEVVGTLDRIHFLRRTLKMTSVIDPPEDLPAHSATLGVIFVYQTKGLPQEVTMEWDLFNERIQKINAATTDEAGGLPYPLSPDDTVLRWQNFLKNPTIPSFVDVAPPSKGNLSITLLGSLCALAIVMIILYTLKKRLFIPVVIYKRTSIIIIAVMVVSASLLSWFFASGPKEEEAKNIALGLLKNVYLAFDYRNEGVVYDVLARSVSGDLLTNIFLEVQGALELENQGGARVKVKEVEITSSNKENLDNSSGFSTELSWTVTGTVGHWGHIHQRKNAYDAVLSIEPIEGIWKITNLQLLNEKRL